MLNRDETHHTSSMSNFRAPAATTGATTLRDLCLRLLADLPAFDRKRFAKGLSGMQRAEDLPAVRNTFFDTIADSLGETTAHERVALLDRHLE
jgi:hypothetical protein